jgi:mRNA-degrading endonuclease RelE of RelBE toxin-antitoxin system
MTPEQPFTIVYAHQVKSHLQMIDRKYYGVIRDTVEAELRFQPDVETKNRKPLKRPVSFEAQWELRFGPGNSWRVFYQVDMERKEVHVSAIEVKRGNRLVVGGEEVEI